MKIKFFSNILGDRKREFTRFKPILEGGKKSLSFCSDTKDPIGLIRKSRCGIIICSDTLNFEKKDYRNRTLVLVKNPRLAFIKTINHYFPKGVEATFKIGKNVIVKQGAVIGTDGFGFERCVKRLIRFPSLGGIVIGDNVEIGADTCIDRGTLGDTVIGDGTKIDNLVHIGHNAKIGKHCLIVANVLIGGSAVIGDECFIGASAVIRDGIKIGKRAFVGMGAVVVKDVAEGETVVGNPAKPIKK